MLAATAQVVTFAAVVRRTPPGHRQREHATDMTAAPWVQGDQHPVQQRRNSIAPDERIMVQQGTRRYATQSTRTAS
jgi:hypothetical protein